VIVYFGRFFENYRNSQQSWTAFFHVNSYVLLLSQNGWSYIVLDIFTNTSGTHVIILKIFSPINLAKKLVFFAQTTACFYKNLIITLYFFRKTPLFFR
jgi:hypothetical protein